MNANDRMESLTVTEKLPVWGRCDVVVVGAAAAGISAAVAAAEAGRRVIWLENEILPEERRDAGLWKRLQEKQVRICPDMTVVEVYRKGGRPAGLVVADAEGTGLIRADALVDATPDGTLSVKAGAEGRREPLYAGTVFGLEQVDHVRALSWMRKKEIPHHLSETETGGEIRFYLPELSGKGWSGILPRGEVTFSWEGSEKRVLVSGIQVRADGWNRTDLGIFLTRSAAELTDYLKGTVPGLEQARLGLTAPDVKLSGGFFPAQEGCLAAGMENLFTVKSSADCGKEEGEDPALAGRRAGEAAAGLKEHGRPDMTEDTDAGSMDSSVEEWRHSIPVARECDVFVAGVSAPGIAAALEAAGKNARVILAGREGWLGEKPGLWNAGEEEHRLELYEKLQNAGVELNLNVLFRETFQERERLVILQGQDGCHAVRAGMVVDVR